jgi:hypothetical protein
LLTIGKIEMSNSGQAHITSAYTHIDNNIDASCQSHQEYSSQISDLERLGITPTALTIDPLSTPWFSDQQPQHFRSGCAPIMALQQAVSLIKNGTHAVIIRANEPLKTGYTRQERHQLMAVYHKKTTIADLYNELAVRFINQQELTDNAFMALSGQLFKNYQTTYQHLIDAKKAHFTMPAQQWFSHVTPLFRGVDCANPLVDFSGTLLLCSEGIVEQLGLKNTVCVAGVDCQEFTTLDEQQDLDNIAKYEHLQQAYINANLQANINFNNEYEQGNALLEVYTCYPVVPMAFLLKNGFVSQWQDLSLWLQTHQITVTGGMNLARAPWNAPTLNALITMAQQLSQGNKQYGLVHGNGGLGYRQGVAILEKG